MSKLTAKWNYPTTVRFGAGRIAELPDALAATGIKRPLFVTDPGLAKLPVVAATLRLLDDAKVPYGVFSDVKPNPVESNLAAGIEAFRKGKHDGVIAFGGGSALDLGKLIDGDTLKSILRSLILVVVWVPYMLNSVRVRNTFTA